MLARGDAVAARDLCLDLIRNEKKNARVFNTLGRAMNNLGNLPDAERAFQDAIRHDANLAEAHHNLGHVLRKSGRMDEAIASFRQSVTLDPAYSRGHHNLGLTYMAVDRPELAVSHLEQAVAQQPEDSRYRTHLGVVNHKLKEFSAAIEAYGQAIDLDATNVEAHTNLAITLHETGDLDGAETHYRGALELRPGDPKIHDDLANLLLLRGRTEAALEVCDHCLQLMPGYCGALATRAVALYELGRDDEANRLVDFDRLLARREIESPAAFESLTDFNKALADHVSNHPTLKFEPVGHATRCGRQTGDLLRHEKGPVAFLEEVFNKEVARYVDEHPASPDHQFLTRPPENWALTPWAVVMQSQGHQLPHIHPAAWLSGVYYVSLPELIGRNDDDRAGWIEFGMPPDDIRGRVTPPLKYLQPREGLLLLFPSYFYHRTEPFDSDQPRISIAFDVLRRDRS